jgi:hypothetical protein
MIALRKTYQGDDLLANKFIIKKNNFVRKPVSNYEAKMKNSVDPLDDLDNEDIIRVDDNTSKEGSVYDVADIPFERKVRGSVDANEAHLQVSQKSLLPNPQQLEMPRRQE